MSYTAAQLVSLACQICNCPGRLAQAGQMMNLILADYAETLDLDIIRLDSTLSVGPNAAIPYFQALPSNYLRMYDIYYYVNGATFNPVQMELKELDSAPTELGINNYPTNYATDMSKIPPEIAFFPPPSVPLTIYFRYRPASLDISSPETSSAVPYFPNQLILLKEMCIQIGDVAGGDDRSGMWTAEVKRRMEKYLIMDNDSEGFAQTVKLDPRSFRSNTNLPPSKKLGF